MLFTYYKIATDIKSLGISNLIVDLSDNDNPQTKSVLIRKSKLRFLIFLEFLSKNFNGRLYQMLSLRPAEKILLIPYNACVRDSDFIDYTIIDKEVADLDVNPSLSNKENIIFMPKIYLIFNIDLVLSELYEYQKKKLFSHSLILLRKSLLTSINTVVFINFSDSNKLTNKLIRVWKDILFKMKDSILILKYSNDSQSINIKSILGEEKVRFIDFNTCSREQILSFYLVSDMYLDSVFSQFENVIDCLITNLPVLTLCKSSYSPNTKITSSILFSLGLIDGVVFTYEDYGLFPLNQFSENGKNDFLEYKYKVSNHLIRLKLL